MTGPHHWRRSPADNGSADPNADVRPSRPAKTVLGAIRGLMATAAAARDDDLGGLVATLAGSTTNVYAVTSNEGLVDIATGINNVPPAITAPFILRLSFDTTLAGSTANAPHLKVDSFDCGPILRRDGSALVDGDLVAGTPVIILGDMAASTDTKVTRVRVLDLTPSDLASAGAGSFLGLRIFDVAGTGTYTPTPGTKSIEFELVGAGGGGGCGGATGGCGDGAESGIPVEGRIDMTGVASIAYVIGGGGQPTAAPGAVGTRGATGGTSSLGNYATAPGGIGGLNGGVPGVNGGTTGGSLSGCIGKVGASNPGSKVNQVGSAGNGGAGPYGGAGLGADGNNAATGTAMPTAGGSGRAPGSGGGGGDNVGAASGTAFAPGGPGADGALIIHEYR